VAKKLGVSTATLFQRTGSKQQLMLMALQPQGTPVTELARGLVPENQRAGLAMSVGLALAGALIGATVATTPFFTLVAALLALFGVGTGVFTLLSPRFAQRKVGNVEAKLSSLRVKERTIDRRFEAQTAEVTGLLKALKLGSIDDLEQAVEDYKRAGAQVAELEGKCARARAVFPNCRRYVHTHGPTQRSVFVPVDGEQPPVPDWKLDEWFAGTLPDGDPALDAANPSAPSIPRF